MKKTLPLALLFLPYLILLGAFLIFKLADSELTIPVILAILLFSAVAYLLVGIPNLMNAAKLWDAQTSAEQFLFWTVLIKCCAIPFYLLFLLDFGVCITLFAVLWPAAILLLLLILPFLFFSSVYGVRGLARAKQEQKLSQSSVATACVLQFIPFADAIFLLILYRKLKKAATATS